MNWWEEKPENLSYRFEGIVYPVTGVDQSETQDKFYVRSANDGWYFARDGYWNGDPEKGHIIVKDKPETEDLCVNWWEEDVEDLEIRVFEGSGLTEWTDVESVERRVNDFYVSYHPEPNGGTYSWIFKRDGYAYRANYSGNRMAENKFAQIRVKEEGVIMEGKCSHCGKDITESSPESLHVVRERTYCDECFDELYAYCGNCDKLVSRSRCYYSEHYEKYICSSCKAEMNYCEGCEEYFYDSDSNHYDNGSLCNNCSENYYRCENCGNFVHENNVYELNGSDYCESCYEDLRDSDSEIIREYKDDPELIFYHTDKGLSPYIGVEVEVEKNSSNSENPFDVSVLEEIPEDYFWMTTDGSLNWGFEIKNHPMSLNWIKDNISVWKNMFDKLEQSGTHTEDTCGTHFHISKQFLNAKDRLKLLIFFERHWDDLVKLSLRREYGNIQAYARKYGQVKEIACKKIVDGDGDYGRYFAINLCPARTVEIRLFGGISNIVQFEYLLDLVEQILRAIKAVSIFEVKAITIEEILRGMRKDHRKMGLQLLREGLCV